MRLKLLLCITLLILVALPRLDTHAQNTQELYAYLVVNADGSGSIRGVDPTNPLQAQSLYSIAVNSGETVVTAFLSPHRKLAVVVINHNQTKLLRLVDLSTNTNTDIVDNFSFPLPTTTLNSGEQNIAWSPDGRYFAINYVANNTGERAIYLYDTISKQLTDLKYTQANQYRIAWSHDSSKLAYVDIVCSTTACTDTSLQIINAANGSTQKSIDLMAFSRGKNSESTNFCELQWSPNDIWLAFVDLCDTSSLGIHREVQVVNSATGTITQATHLTPTNVAAENSTFRAVYNLAWTTNNILLVGVEKREGQLFDDNGVLNGQTGPLTTTTLVYEPTNAVLSTIDNRKLGQWAVSQSQLGYVVYNYPQGAVSDTFANTANVEIATFSGQRLTPVLSSTSGCLLAWNSSGTMLAYIPKGINLIQACTPNTDTIQILDATNKQVITHDTGRDDAIALGWINLAETPSTVTPMPKTEIPTTATITSTPTNIPPTSTNTATPTSTLTSTLISCQLYPITLSADAIKNVTAGTTLNNIQRGTKSGNFGWLTWTGNMGVPIFVTSLTPPGDSNIYTNPDNSADHVLSVGDWVKSKHSASNSSQVRKALDALKSVDITIPVWDQVRGGSDDDKDTGKDNDEGKLQYHIIGFAKVRLLSYDITGSNKISLRFIGYTDCGFAPTATPTPTATATKTATP